MGAKPNPYDLYIFMPQPDLKDEFWLRVKLPVIKHRQRHHLWKVIHDVAETKNLWRFAQVLKDADIARVTSCAGIALSAAADVGHLNMVKHVLAAKTGFDIQYVQSAMRSAIRHNNVEMLSVLLDHTDLQKSKPDHLWQKIENAAVYVRPGFIKEMIKRGHTPQPSVAKNLLTGMILYQDVEAVDMLLAQRDFLPNAHHLSMALEKANPQIVQSLIDAGANCQSLVKSVKIEGKTMHLHMVGQGQRSFPLGKTPKLMICLRHIKTQIEKEQYAMENHKMPRDVFDISLAQARQRDGALLVQIALSGKLPEWMRARAKQGEYLNHQDFQNIDPKTKMHILEVLGHKKQLKQLFQPQNWVHNLNEMKITYQTGVLLRHRTQLEEALFHQFVTKADKMTLEDQNRQKIKKISRDSITIKRRPK